MYQFGVVSSVYIHSAAPELSKIARIVNEGPEYTQCEHQTTSVKKRFGEKISTKTFIFTIANFVILICIYIYTSRTAFGFQSRNYEILFIHC